MTTSFQRHLSESALRAFEPLVSQLRRWNEQRDCAVHLRSGDSLGFYWRGQRALRLSLSHGRLMATPFRGSTAELAGPDGLGAALDQALTVVQHHVAEQDVVGELAEQASLVDALQRGRGEFLPVDEQVRLPRAALSDPARADPELAEVRVDLLVLERSSGVLFLVEVKLATSEELDGPVLDQLRRTRAIPCALRDGSTAFLEHYGRVLQQRRRLGLTDGEACAPSSLRTACVVVGSAAEALARIACWEALSPDLAELELAIVPGGSPLRRRDLRPLIEVHAGAAATPRAPYAPRRPRWNEFTRQEDERQGALGHTFEASRNLPTLLPGQLGAYATKILAHCDTHGIRLHREIAHPRSSQAACMQLFAPALMGSLEARSALARLLRGRWPEAVGEGAAVTDCDFELPHRSCHEGLWCQGDATALLGEQGAHGTSLDAALLLDGADGVRTLVGIEVKYTEPEFSCCGGFRSAKAGEDRWACLGGADRRARCYLRRLGRRYLRTGFRRRMFAPGQDPLQTESPCLLLGPANQLYRNHAAVRAIAENLSRTARPLRSLFLVLYHGENRSLLAPERTIPGHSPFPSNAVERYRAALRPEMSRTFGILTFNELIEAYGREFPAGVPPWLAELRARYGKDGHTAVALS